MRSFLTVITLLICSSGIFAQKQIIDTNVYKRWTSPNSPAISNDGKYVVFNIQNAHLGKESKVVLSTESKWKREFKEKMINPVITRDSKSLFYIKGKDTLAMILLANNTESYIPKVSSFVLKEYANGEWLCYMLENGKKDLVLRNTATNEKKIFSNISKWQLSEDGNILLLWKAKDGIPGKITLNWFDLKTGGDFEVCQSYEESNVVLDSKYRQLVFCRGDSVFYFSASSKTFTAIPKGDFVNADDGVILSSLDKFSKDGKCLFVSVNKEEHSNINKAGVQIWSYLDSKLPSEKDYWSKTYQAVFNLSSRKIIWQQEKLTDQIHFPNSDSSLDTIALIISPERELEPWSISAKLRYSLINLRSGKSNDLSFLNGNKYVNLSASGRYIIYYNNSDNSYYIYEIKTGRIRNVTANLATSWVGLYRDDMVKSPRGVFNSIWGKNDEFVLIYDSHDIWNIDPLNQRSSFNVTNGYGMKHQIVFNLLNPKNFQQRLSKKQKIYLSAFNTVSKDNGFYSVNIDKKDDPELLTMGPFIFNTSSGYLPSGVDFPPIKAKDAEIYLVQRMSVNDAPNFFCTQDFKTFKRLSDIQPQKKYNWYTTELHTWTSLDGRQLQGILYKPEDFDSLKIYPVIFHYYERKSDGLNTFIRPEVICDGCNIDIPTYVSQGYLVFTPDIYYEIGNPMNGTYNSVISAAKYLSSLPFVNANRMGIQGCSWGAYQTNYLVTHSNMFAAATSCSGVADFISSYGSLDEEGVSLQSNYELGQARMGGTLWDNQVAYINNSPIFQVDRITTPLLIMHTKKDGVCLYANIMEFFTGLRRLGKRSWMLVYPEGNHGIYGREAIDFSERMMQFFNHYLKDKPAPIWMTNNIENNCYTKNHYDNTLKTPGPGLLTQKEQKKVDSLLERRISIR